MSVRFTVRGAGATELSVGSLGEHVETWNIGQVTRDAASSISVEAQDDDLVEIVHDGGLVELRRVEDLGIAQRGGDRVVEIPAVRRRVGTTRDASGWVVQTVRKIRLEASDLAKWLPDASEVKQKLLSAGIEAAVAEIGRAEVTRAVLRAIEDGLDRKCVAPDALYRIGEDGRPEPVEDLEAAEGPVVLMVHGTFSNVEGAFDGLWHTDEWRAVLKTQAGRPVLAWQHRTLSDSPIDNALALATALPEGADLSIVSHSRGGIVGDLLAVLSGPGDPLASIRAAAEGSNPRRKGVVELFKALEPVRQRLMERRITVARHVRAGAPMRGTPIAGRRLDGVASGLLTALGLGVKLAGPAASAAYELARAAFLAVLRLRSDGEAVPGLAAMDPTAPLLAWLAASEGTGELCVVAADVQGDTFWKRVGVGVADLLFLGDHDLVVDTRSMFGGPRRAASGRALLVQGPDTTHFTYFHRGETRGPICVELRGERSEHFRDLNDVLGNRPGLARGALVGLGVVKPPSSPTSSRGTIVLVPGIMGSHLAIGQPPGRREWADVARLATGGLGRLRSVPGAVAATDLLGGPYKAIVEYLSTSWKVVLFPYDWRRSVIDAGGDLAARLARELEDPDRTGPVHLLAHSMGGLVCRAVQLHEDGVVWRRFKEAGGRLVQAGTPNGGAHHMLRAVSAADDSFLRGMALLDLTATVDDLRSTILGFPGVLELFPWWDKGGVQPHWQEDAWWPKGGPAPVRTQRKGARAVQQRLERDAPVDRELTRYIAGVAPETYDGWERGAWTVTPHGDGRVPWASGIPAGVRTWYVPAVHGDLLAHRPSFRGLEELLDKGDTRMLSGTPLADGARGPGSPPRPAAESRPPSLLPDEAELVRAAIGMSNPTRTAPPERIAIQFRVTCASLLDASHPLMVGHYRGESLSGAGEFLDRQLSGELSRLARARRLPEDGRARVVLQAGSRPRGAVVVGLGRSTELTAGHVNRAVRAGVQDYLDAIRQRHDVARVCADPLPGHGAQTNAVKEGLSVLLLGAGARSWLSRIDALRALVLGVLEAVEQSRAEEAARGVLSTESEVLTQVEVIELYEDVALGAYDQLAMLAMDPTLGSFDHVYLAVADRFDRKASGGSRRVALGSGPVRPLRIRAARTERLVRWDLDAGGSRTEPAFLKVDDAYLEDLGRAAGASTRPREPEVDGVPVGSRLCEYALPAAWQERLEDDGDVQLELDRDAARLPWELLRHQELREPLTVRAPLVRVLTATEGAGIGSEPRLPVSSRTASVLADLEPAYQLPGAAEEGRRVAGLLEARGFAVQQEISPSTTVSTARLRQLLAFPVPRILHVATHGDLLAPRAGRPPAAAVLVDRLFGAVIDGEELERWQGDVPEVVFLNCCLVGLLQQGDAFAVGVAAKLLDLGVRTVVVSAWSVEDGPAADFAETFYRALVAGSTLGRAALEARRTVWNAWPDSNSWAAYQVYGDVSWRLDVGDRPTVAMPDRFVFERDFVDAVDAFRAEALHHATVSVGVDLDGFVADKLTMMEDAIARFPHLGTARTFQALGMAWSELGGLRGRTGAGTVFDAQDAALRWLERALAATEGTAHVVVLERTLDLHTRLLRAAPAGRRVELVARGDKVAAALLALHQLAPTGERAVLLASYAKSRALLERGRERRARVLHAAELYGGAARLKRERGEPDAWYPSVVEFGLRVAVGEPAGASAKTASDLLERSPSSDWYSCEARILLRVLNAAADGTLPTKTDELLKAYTDQTARFLPDQRKRSSAVDFYEYLSKVGSGGEAQRLRAWATELRQRWL